MKSFNSIKSYCEAIGIPKPKYEHFDIRSFEENMSTVVHKMPPFRHSFYALAIKVNGKGKAISSFHNEFPDGAVVFFNSPFQILSWDIAPDWEGFYVMMTKDFLAKSHLFKDLLDQFPFLKIEHAIPFSIHQKECDNIVEIYTKIYREYHSDNIDKFNLINAYVYLLLNHLGRYFKQQVSEDLAVQKLRTANLKLLSRYEKLIETYLRSSNSTDSKKYHSPSFYAEILHVHPNHLNAVIKNISGNTALQYIHNHIIHLAKSYLIQTNLSIKEIAFDLHFDAPNNFNNFFKKHTSLTPGSFRKASKL